MAKSTVADFLVYDTPERVALAAAETFANRCRMR